MRWQNLAFLHWPLPASLLTDHLPPGLTLDTWDGKAWLGVVPFLMTDVRPRGFPATWAFPELNLRTYVTAQGIPGVWFFSLDAASRSAVWSARRFFHLPYFNAQMSILSKGSGWRYESKRLEEKENGTHFIAEYGPSSSVFFAKDDSLEAWLTQRYFLYSADARGRLWRGEVRHDPWPLQEAWVNIESCSLADHLGVQLQGKPLAHYAHNLAVHAWPLRPVK